MSLTLETSGSLGQLENVGELGGLYSDPGDLLLR